MKWKQFFTPVTSINGIEAKQLSAEQEDEIVYLDVRQPKEYKASHIPGSKLIPLGELDSRLDELDPEKPLVVY